MTEQPITTWRQVLTTSVLVFVIAASGCAVAFAFWLRDISSPQVVVLGTGSRLSVLVADGPARLVLATGDEPIAYGNALARFQPLFARRVDLLLVAGQDQTLRVPEAALNNRHTRAAIAIAPLLPSPETQAIGLLASFDGPRHIRLGPNIDVTVETALPYGSQTGEVFPAWRAIIERQDSRIVVLSDGESAALFPAVPPASVLIVSGPDPAEAWELTPAVALLTNAEAISGPDLRDVFAASDRGPSWGFRVSPGEALQLRFVENGLEIPAESAQPLGDAP